MNRNVLPTGTRLGDFCIADHIGEDNCSLYYRGEGVRGQSSFLIREVFPADQAHRTDDGLMLESEAVELAFQETLAEADNRFAKLSTAKPKGVLPVRDRLLLNGTYYLVSDWPRHETLWDRYYSAGEFSSRKLRGLLKRILPTLARLHQLGFTHNGLSPDTIFVGGSSVEVSTPDLYLNGDLKPFCSAGPDPASPFTPPERSPGPQGDIYALGAICFQLATGKAAANAAERKTALSHGKTDPLDIELLRDAIGRDKALFGVVMTALEIDPAMRPAEVQFMQNALNPFGVARLAGIVAGISLPTLRLPDVRRPDLPKLTIPRVSVPGFVLPRISVPRWRLPVISMPGVGLPKLSVPRVPKRIAFAALGGLTGLAAIAFALPNLPQTSPGSGMKEEMAGTPVPTPSVADAMLSQAPEAGSHLSAADVRGVNASALSDTLNAASEMHLAAKAASAGAVEDDFKQRDAAAWAKARKINSWASYKAYLDGFGEDAARTGAHAKEARKVYYVRSAERAEQVREARRLLSSLGYPVGEGHLMDYRLSGQIVEFERTHNLPVKGDVTDRLLRALQKEAAAPLKEPKTPTTVFDPCAEKSVS